MGVKKICYVIIINFVFLSLISCNTTEPITCSPVEEIMFGLWIH